jgi:hypothetical protein
MDIRRDHEAEIAAPDQLQITMDVVAPPQLAIHGLAQQIEVFSLKLLPFFGRPIRPPSIKASLPPRMLFHLATELLFLLDTARLPFGSDLPEHFPSLTATLLLVSNLLALFRWQIPATLLPTARDRLAFGFQSRQPSRASRPHAR